MAMGSLLGHLIYGAVLGALYGSLVNPEFRRRRWHNGRAGLGIRDLS